MNLALEVDGFDSVTFVELGLPKTAKLNSSFSLSRNKHGTKKYIWNRPVEEAKKMKCYKRLIYKQFVQISGLCGPQFLS